MIHPADCFEAIYCLNLDRRLKRWERLKSRLMQWGLTAQRFAAVDGNEPAIVMEYQQLVGRSIRFNRRQQCYNISSPNAFACLLSHAAIIDNAIKHRYRRILVLEDDAFLHQNFLVEFQKMRRLPSGWKLLYLGASQYRWQDIQRYNNSFYYASNSLGAFAVAIDHAIYQPLLDLFQQKQCAVDQYFCKIQANYAGKCFVFFPNLVIADVTESDLRPSRNQVRHAAQMRWDLSLYDVSHRLEAMPSVLPVCPSRHDSNSARDRFHCIRSQVRTNDGVVDAGICQNCRFAGWPERIGQNGWP